MLDSLCGRLLEFEDDFAIVDVGGVRFHAAIPSSTASQFPEVGGEVTLLTRLSFNANDGQFALFGFATPMERECFDTLCGMTGIGPRKALGILSQIEIGAFARAIVERDMRYISKIKGVGQKTAERLIVELREKMVPLAVQNPAASVPLLPQKENVRDAIEALMALGCKQVIAEKAVKGAVEALGEDASVQDLIREGLKRR